METHMPDVTVVIPTAAVPADRLTLGATDARVSGSTTVSNAGSCYAGVSCMAEE